ncbi:MAG: DEAD/DEAH box helicase [Burkholderiales bacterium]|nr:DEAD/DEAH box helicase [Burkholderiales bacterium]
MRAWLLERDDAEQPALQLRPVDELAYAALREALSNAGLLRPLAQLDAAHAVLHQKAPDIPFFVPPPQDGWQLALAALAAIGSGEIDAPAAATAKSESRLWWVLDIDDQGVARSLEPWEQKLGVRGWGRPKEVPLSRLAKADGLAPADAAVARCIRLVPAERQHRIDLAAALQALVGHARLAFVDAPELAVTLVEATPELEVVEHGDDLLVRLNPPPVVDDPAEALAQDSGPYAYYRPQPSAAELKEREALRSLRVLRDEPQRARLLRYSPAQKRVAKLVGLGLTVPRAAAGQLQKVLAGLGSHFQIQGDELQASREVPTDPRLRAELTPDTSLGLGGLMLRLVVAPLGAEGPRLAPGAGRPRLIATVAGETLGAQRDLAAELSHLDTVIEACPMLGALPPARHPGQIVPALWTIESPDAALALVERLHSLNAVMALDWPKGKAIRVESAGIAQLTVQVHSGTEWLALDGGVNVDEQLVTTLSKLLDWASASKSRFMPLGEGRYLVLTEELRARLDDLAAVGEAPRAGAKTKAGDDELGVGNPGEGRWGGTGALRLPAVAAGWLSATLDGAALSTDGAYRDRVETLVRAQHWQPRLPGTLQAELRPYQLEGYQWAMRLAEAGLGAVLADDMGLGKTLQAIAVMLERAAGGAALVVAPTSLIGNWAAELRRFAPSLEVHVFAEGDRDALIEQAGAAEVVLISYQLQLLHSEALTARRWHTLVLDEAQAIKNAAAKRSQAAFELQADFRLALSGTPIENRLAELWAIMRVCNPGLLGTPAQFNARFAGPIERDRQTGPRRTLRRLIAPFVLRRTKAQVLDDLPPRTELLLRVQGNETELAHYEALRRQAVVEAHEALSGAVSAQAHFNILAQLTKLRRAACDPRLVTPDLKQPGAKVTAFAELAAELVANGHKALVFSQFVDFLTLLREPLDAAGIAYQYLDGSTPGPERSRRVAAFQAGEGELFLISLKAGGFGLNLTVADYVVIADPWWNPAAEDQASGRAHRIGQLRPVTVYRLVNTGTLEERIVALHESKRELADSVLEADGDAEALGPLKADELMALMLPPRMKADGVS